MSGRRQPDGRADAYPVIRLLYKDFDRARGTPFDHSSRGRRESAEQKIEAENPDYADGCCRCPHGGDEGRSRRVTARIAGCAEDERDRGDGRRDLAWLASPACDG